MVGFFYNEEKEIVKNSVELFMKMIQALDYTI